MPRSRPDWLTIPEAAQRVARDTNGDYASEAQVLQLCAEGHLTLSLRLSSAKATPWGPLPENWWKATYIESRGGGEVVTLNDLFDVSLDEGGRALIDAIRWDALGKGDTGIWLDGGGALRIKVTGSNAVAFALLTSAAYFDVGTGAPADDPVMIAGHYKLQAASWPLSKFDRTEPVIRGDVLERWLRGAVGHGGIEADPARRLRELRELGGAARWVRGRWQIKGITELVRREKARSHPRSDQKTIRADLKEAAEGERLEKRAGTLAAAWGA